MKVKFEDNFKKVEIESTSILNINDRKIIDLLEACDLLYYTVNLKDLKVKQQANPIEFKYTFEAIDGRKWSQILRKNTGFIDMNFAVTDFWKLKEFEPHRAIRDCVVTLLIIGVINIEILWL